MEVYKHWLNMYDTVNPGKTTMIMHVAPSTSTNFTRINNYLNSAQNEAPISTSATIFLANPEVS